jgi:hypothetical protein
MACMDIYDEDRCIGERVCVNGEGMGGVFYGYIRNQKLDSERSKCFRKRAVSQPK